MVMVMVFEVVIVTLFIFFLSQKQFPYMSFQF